MLTLIYSCFSNERWNLEICSNRESLIEVQALASLGIFSFLLHEYMYPYVRPQQPSSMQNFQILLKIANISAGIHDNIVRYYNSFHENEYLYIQLQLCDFNLKSVNLADERFTSQKALLNMIYQVWESSLQLSVTKSIVTFHN